MKRLGIILVLAVFVITGCGSAQSSQKPTAPRIPHRVSADMNCLSCHKTGENGAKVTTHPDKPNCLSCHQPAAQ
ncbi:MAG TPA: hypothetical protein VHQ46_07435 [Desulfobacteria bacterium]|nr:hypothetical protein [Desulfobacteria bacterium]